MTLVELYEDGFVWTNAAKRVTLADPEAATNEVTATVGPNGEVSVQPGITNQ